MTPDRGTVRSVKSVTYRLDADVDVVALGARSGLLWTRENFAVAGIGEALRIPVARPDGGRDAQESLAVLAGPDEVEAPGTGPLAFAAFDFDPTAPGELVVPELTVGTGNDGRRWITVTGDSHASDSGPPDGALDRIREVLDRAVPNGPEPTQLNVTSSLPPEIWRDEVVGYATDRIRAGELDKAVLARELVLRTDHPLDQAAVLDRLRSSYRSAILFGIDGFVGASPELLVSRTEDVVRAHPLAGTAARASDPQNDQKMAAGLLASTKDRWEHRITIDWLLDTLLPFCSYVDAEPEPTIVSLANVHHLGTRVEGRLSGPPASVLELVGALHPTPAVGGAPQDKALALIRAMERAERGRYGGPVGWVDAKGNGAFAVAIRSAQMNGNEVRFFAGVGVVKDSDPAAELAETRAKFQAMQSALMRP